MRTALAISAVAHTLLWVPLTWSGSEPLPKPAEDPIVVDIVTPDQVAAAPKADNADKPLIPAKEDVPEASTPAPAAPAPATPKASSQAKANAKPAAEKPSPTKPSAAKPSPAPQRQQEQAQAQLQPQPMPSPLPAQPSAPSNWLDTALMSPPVTESPFDVAETGANLAPDEVETFKAHMQSCWKPSAGLASAKSLMVVLRVSLNPDGALAGEPTLLAASASEEGPALIETATRALRACQPYGFLPTAKYKEWKLLDLSFTPSGLSVLPRVLSSASP